MLWPKKCNFLHRLCIYIYGQWQANSGPKADCGKPSYPMGSGKPTAARRPTTASHHTLWAVASQQRPEGQLWQAITPYTYMHAHITHAINHEHVVAPLKCCCKYWTLYGCYVCVYDILEATCGLLMMSFTNPFVVHCSGSMLSLVWVRMLEPEVCGKY